MGRSWTPVRIGQPVAITLEHPAISRAFLELGLLAARAPSEHTERSTALVSVLAPAGSLEPGPATSTVAGRRRGG
eukprot:scaffold6123_cov113-Isochrysis_galbana.AAC.2